MLFDRMSFIHVGKCICYRASHCRLVEECSRITKTHRVGDELRWVSWGRLVVLVGEVEALQLVAENAIDTRPHPTRLLRMC